ncbi:hypothetical protein [Zavarzinella formosa]|uniref:hypothetical protein n=1 Tax=Zavarzinella formosa TaxID=360055 RepID=UPI000362C349|nr:hypothetical protein [Zavarzinella formosa]
MPDPVFVSNDGQTTGWQFLGLETHPDQVHQFISDSITALGFESSATIFENKSTALSVPLLRRSVIKIVSKSLWPHKNSLQTCPEVWQTLMRKHDSYWDAGLNLLPHVTCNGEKFSCDQKSQTNLDFPGAMRLQGLGFHDLETGQNPTQKWPENTTKHPSGDHFWTVGHPPHWSKTAGKLNTFFQNPRQIDISPDDFGVIRPLLTAFLMAQNHWRT